MTIQSFQNHCRKIAKNNGNGLVTLNHAGLAILANMDEASTLLEITDLIDVNKYLLSLKKAVKKDKTDILINEDEIVFSPSVDSIIQGAVLVAKSTLDVTCLHLVIEYFNSVIDKNDDELILLQKSCEDPSFLRIQLKAMLGGETIESIENYDDDGMKSYTELAAPLNDYFCGNNENLHRLISLANTRKGSIITIVGDKSSGKTALVDKFNFWLQTTNEIKAKQNILSLDVSTLIKTSAFRGTLEQYLASAITACIEQNSILLLDNIHYLNDAHRDPEFMPFFAEAADQGVTIICTTTTDTFSIMFEKKGYRNRVERIDLKEPDSETRLEIITQIAREISNRDEVVFTANSLKTLNGIIDESFCKNSISKSIEFLERAAILHDDNVIHEKVILNTISENKGAENNSLISPVIEKVKKLAEIVKGEIYGQDEAIDNICHQIQLGHLGLKVRTNQPQASFMLLGASGIGKTETTEVISRELNTKSLVLNMSEFQEHHTISKLIGAPVGYVGSDKGHGMLAEFVSANPKGIIVFDEIEKAHHRIFDLLLSVLDKGTLTTSTQKEIDFTQNLIFFTSNCGAGNIGKNDFGLIKDVSAKEVVDRSTFEKTFSPEFRNRLTSIIDFKTLEKTDIAKVVNKSLNKIINQVKNKFGLEITISDGVIDHIGNKYFDKVMGARPIERGVETEIGKLLGQFLLNNSNEKKIKFKLDDNQIKLETI